MTKPQEQYRAIYFQRVASKGQCAYGAAKKFEVTVLKVGKTRAEVEFEDGRRAFVNLDNLERVKPRAEWA